MERVRTSPRPHWQAKLEEIGFPFHTEADGTAYWDESAHWRFSLAEIETLEAAAEEVYRLCEEAVGHVVTRGLYEAVGIPRWAAPAIEARHTWYPYKRGFSYLCLPIAIFECSHLCLQVF